MNVKALFAWLRKNDAKASFGFRKKVPYISIKVAGARVRYKLGDIGELEGTLVSLIKDELEGVIDAQSK
jgi:hypothetical protein